MNFQSFVSQTRQSLIAPTLFALLKPSAVVSSFYRCFAVIIYGAIPEIGDSRETLAYSFCSPKLLSAWGASADLSLFGCGLLSQIFVFV